MLEELGRRTGNLDSATPHLSANLAGILAMIASMASFTVNDSLVKLTGSSLPLGEMIFIRNGAAAAITLAFMAGTEGLRVPQQVPAGLIGFRLAGEIGATLFYLSALLLMPIADVTAIGQVTPLAVTATAALLLGEPVGWRRWAAAAVGLFGVLVIVRPGTSVFAPAALLALASIVFVVVRDLVTRRIAASVGTLFLTLVSCLAVMAAGAALSPFEVWRWPESGELAMLAIAGLFLIGGYALIIVAMRSGDIAAVSPFRYSVILFALAAGWAVWGEFPDAISLAGIAVVVAAGLYTFHRELRTGSARRLFTRGPAV